MSNQNQQIKVTGLYFYPIKSCRGIQLDQAQAGNRGFLYDREFMVVTESCQQITQREFPSMALIEPHLSSEGMFLKAPGMEDLHVSNHLSGQEVQVKIWRDLCLAVDQGNQPAQWLSSYLGVPCRLVRMAEQFVRKVEPNYARNDHDQVGFADAYPFLLISEASLEDLNSRIGSNFGMNRFRPNIVVAGCSAYAEDTWKVVRIGEVTFSVVKPCVRCVIPTIDQQTGEIQGKEPLRTLTTYRRNEKGGVLFGQNLLHHSQGSLHIEDQVEILELKQPCSTVNEPDPSGGLAPLGYSVA